MLHSTHIPDAQKHQDRRHARPGIQRSGSPRAHGARRRGCGAPEFFARHGRRPPRARRRWCGRSAARPGARSASWATCRARRSASASSRTARSMLAKGRRFVLDADCELGDDERVGLDYKELPRDVAAGAVLLLDDGKIVLDVDQRARRARCTTAVRHGGVLSNNKGINRQGGGLTAPALTPKDMEDIRTAAKINADYLAVSFPKSSADMYMARRAAARRGRQGLPDRQDRARRGGAQPGAAGHHVRLRRHHGGARRSRGRSRRCLGAGAAEAHDPPGARAQQAHHHRHADDGVDDREPRADARRGVRRRQRGARRHRRGDAVGGIGERQVPGGDHRGDGPHLRRGRAVRSRSAWTRTSSTACSRASTSRSRWRACSPPSTSR